MIAVLQAAKEGKKIQFRKAGNDTNRWEDTSMPNWNFLFSDYRVKPEHTIRPYANAEEFLAAMKEHGPYVKYETKDVLRYLMPTRFTNAVVELDCEYFSYDEITKYNTWQDGHPCGIEE